MLWKGFQKPKRLEVDRESLTDQYGRFYAQPFERGFATTVGNALRYAAKLRLPPDTSADEIEDRNFIVADQARGVRIRLTQCFPQHRCHHDRFQQEDY